MKIYVAGRVKQIPAVREMQDQLIADGHIITFDWTGAEGEQRKDRSAHPDRARELSLREKEAVRQADAVVLVGYGCEEGQGGCGCFIEVGMGMVDEKLIIIYGPARESVFWYLPGVVRADSMPQVSEVLADVEVPG